MAEHVVAHHEHERRQYLQVIHLVVGVVGNDEQEMDRLSIVRIVVDPLVRDSECDRRFVHLFGSPVGDRYTVTEARGLQLLTGDNYLCELVQFEGSVFGKNGSITDDFPDRVVFIGAGQIPDNTSRVEVRHYLSTFIAGWLNIAEPITNIYHLSRKIYKSREFRLRRSRVQCTGSLMEYKGYDKNSGLDGKVAMVTGAAQGIGRAIAETCGALTGSVATGCRTRPMRVY
jgi:hypothetical protein